MYEGPVSETYNVCFTRIIKIVPHHNTARKDFKIYLRLVGITASTERLHFFDTVLNRMIKY